MMLSKTSISIIMATFNRAHLIEETLRSIQKQNFEDWECIIIDDDSTDNTPKVVAGFLSDRRFRYFKRTEDFKKGLPGCRNYGLELASGEYVVFIDDDDIAHPDLLELSRKELLRHNLDYCRYLRKTFTGDFDYNFDLKKDYDLKFIGLEHLDDIITNKLPFNSCQILWKRTCFSCKRFNEELMYGEEWELYNRILINNPKGVSIEKTLFYARKHNKSNTGEYRLNDPVRRNSMKKAIKLVMHSLKKNNLLSDHLIKYFIQSAFFLKDYGLLNSILKNSGLKKSKILTYKIIYQFYPLFRSIFQLKAKIIN